MKVVHLARASVNSEEAISFDCPAAYTWNTWALYIITYFLGAIEPKYQPFTAILMNYPTIPLYLPCSDAAVRSREDVRREKEPVKHDSSWNERSNKKKNGEMGGL